MKITELLYRQIGKWSYKYSNLPERYIKRSLEQVYWRNPKGIQYKPQAVHERRKFKFDLERPWTAQFRNENVPGQYHPKNFVEPIKEWSFFRGDRVQVLVGKDKGKQGFVKQIVEENNWIVVEGLNCELKQVGESKDYSGVYIQSEQPLLVTTQVALVDPSDYQPTPIEWRYTEDGERVRVSVRTGRVIPMPASADETIDYKSKKLYKEQPKDTTAASLSEITFEPKLCTFEMDVMEKMGIKEDRIPPKSFWY